MIKLKALRGAVGVYGRVRAGGIVEVEQKDVDKMLKTGRFVRATDADLEAAVAAQEQYLAVANVGAAAGFAPIATKPDPAEGQAAGMEFDAREKLLREREAAVAAEEKRLDDLRAQIVEEGARLAIQNGQEGSDDQADATGQATDDADADAPAEAGQAKKGKATK